MRMSVLFHEDLSRHSEIRISSARNFGLWFSVIFTVVGLLSLRAGGSVRVWAFWVAAAFLLLALAAPSVLQPLNLAWSKVGLFLAKVINPLVIGLVFFGVVAPIGWMLRLSGKDLLRLRLDPGASSYWLPRVPPGPSPDTMAKQF
jgi:hypothetical protein